MLISKVIMKTVFSMCLIVQTEAKPDHVGEERPDLTFDKIQVNKDPKGMISLTIPLEDPISLFPKPSREDQLSLRSKRTPRSIS